MGRRQEQRAARKAAAPTVAEHPVFDAPERAEDAADAYDKNALDEHAGMCDDGATSKWDLNNDGVRSFIESVLSSDSYDKEKEYAKYSKFTCSVASSGATVAPSGANSTSLANRLEQECPAPFSREVKPSDTGKPSPVSASALTSAELIGVEEDVAMANVGKRWNGKAPRQRADEFVGHQAGGHVAPKSLGFAISSKRRQPKPRSSKVIDETLWSTALLKAVEELKEHYGLKETIEEYYLKMCHVGKSLLATEVQRKTQSIYDYKATKLYQRNARSVVNREAPDVSN
jgi:hypothetical protein